MNKQGRKRHNIVYSTNPEANFDLPEENEEETLPPEKQNLRVSISKKGRKGKTVTIVSNFSGNTESLENLGKELKTKCGVGGSVKDQEIILQGDKRNLVVEFLQSKGYNAKKSGG